MPEISHQQLALEACKAGVDLVQLRLKNMERAMMLSIATETKEICKKYKASFIINDHLDIALEVDADGVHLGNSDLDHFTARKELGASKILGATAYNAKEAKAHQLKGLADYIGLGTFRKTRTKPEITDFLTLDQVASLISGMAKMNPPTIPILVIGGIRLQDIPPLLSVGAYGVAIASLINQSKNKSLMLKQIQEAFASLNPELQK